MMNFISSRSNAREYERQCKNLFREAACYKHIVVIKQRLVLVFLELL